MKAYLGAVTVVTGCLAGGCTAANRAVLVASTAALACDWSQTRSIAATGWYHRLPNGRLYGTSEVNPLLGSHPSTREVDTYFVTAAVLNIALWALLPKRYKAIMPIAVTAVEVNSIRLNVESTQNMDTGNSGLCGL